MPKLQVFMHITTRSFLHWSLCQDMTNVQYFLGRGISYSRREKGERELWLRPEITTISPSIATIPGWGGQAMIFLLENICPYWAYYVGVYYMCLDVSASQSVTPTKIFWNNCKLFIAKHYPASCRSEIGSNDSKMWDKCGLTYLMPPHNI